MLKILFFKRILEPKTTIFMVIQAIQLETFISWIKYICDGVNLKIAFFEQKDLRNKHVKNALKEHHLEFYENPLTMKNVNDVKDFEIISVFYNSKIDEQIIKQLPKLKLIVAGCTGIDNVDIKACKKENIAVCNVPCYCTNTVAEHTFSLILSLARNIHKAYV